MGAGTGEGPIDLEEEVSDAVLQRRHLAAKIDKAAATNRLLIISALPPPPDCSACEPQADVWHGRAELLEGLRAQVTCSTGSGITETWPCQLTVDSSQYRLGNPQGGLEPVACVVEPTAGVWGAGGDARNLHHCTSR